MFPLELEVSQRPVFLNPLVVIEHYNGGSQRDAEVWFYN